MTMEAKIGHYFKRLTMIENTFGDTDYHLRRVTDARRAGVAATHRHSGAIAKRSNPESDREWRGIRNAEIAQRRSIAP